MTATSPSLHFSLLITPPNIPLLPSQILPSHGFLFELAGNRSTIIRSRSFGLNTTVRPRAPSLGIAFSQVPHRLTIDETTAPSDALLYSMSVTLFVAAYSTATHHCTSVA